MYSLRPYQQEAVDATITHFKQQRSPGIIVLPTGAGKSLVIAELAKVARGRVLVLAHVRELVEQNHAKYESYGLAAGIYSAGLNRKEKDTKVIFGSIQSVARASDDFFESFSLLIIDECHRVSPDEDTQYATVVRKLRAAQPRICIIGLTATPYRIGQGWLYQYNYKGMLRSDNERFFKKCIYEVPLASMINDGYLTQPVQIDSPVQHYDFSSLKLQSGSGTFNMAEVEALLKSQERVTPGIVDNIVDMSRDRQGVMLFAGSVRHANEVLNLLPKESSALVIGDTEDPERDKIIADFKARKIKFLVNVSVLTTGFDAPHVDLIAILRPTESVSLYQQIVGRGLRLSEGKTDCLILDYTGAGHDIFAPEIGEDKPKDDSVMVEVSCPRCQFKNLFWGLVDEQGVVVEHYGRKCRGASENPRTFALVPCSFRFRFKLCERCGAENDISARACSSCDNALVDPDTTLREAIEMDDAHVMRPDSMSFEKTVDKKGSERLEVRYYDLDANRLSEYFYLNNPADFKAFYYNFIRMHHRTPERKLEVKSADDVIHLAHRFRLPLFVIARKQKNFWKVREKVFL